MSYYKKYNICVYEVDNFKNKKMSCIRLRCMVLIYHRRRMNKLYSENVKVDLEKKIKNNIYTSNQQLPSEQELMNEYSVSRVTIRRVTQKLVDEGTLYRKRGIGTFVAEPKVVDPLSTKFGLKKRIEQNGHIIETVECTIEQVNILLDSKNVAPVYLIRRIRDLDGTPLVLSYTYICTNIDLKNKQMEVKDSLYELLKSHGTIITSFCDEVSACLIDEDIAKSLKLPSNSVVLKKCRDAFNDKGEKIEYSYSYYNPFLYKYKTNMKVEERDIDEI